MEILIERTDLYWYSSLFGKNYLFNNKDVVIDAPLMNIFLNSITDVFKDEMDLHYGEHYQSSKVRCSFKESTATYHSSTFEFEMCIQVQPEHPFPSYYFDFKSKEAIELRKELKFQMKEGILDKYGMHVEIDFNLWAFGSLKIGGFLFLSTGELSKDMKEGILNTLKEVASEYFHSPRVVIEERKKFEVDKSKLNLSLIITPRNEDVASKIEENKENITKWFLSEVNCTLKQGRRIFL